MQQTEYTIGQIRPVECFKEGWELIRPHYWMMFAVTLVGMLIAGIIPFGIGVGAIYCGIYIVLFRLVDGKPPDFSDLFKGFNHILPALIATLVLVIPLMISVVIMWISMFGILLSMTDSRGRVDESAIFALYGTIFLEGLIMAVVLGCIHAFIIFTYPLIVERNLSGVEAFKLSAKAVWANLGGVVGLMLCQFALALIGLLACSVGVYFTIPLMFAGVFSAYRRVFPNPASRSFSPPPNAYRGI